jgi:polyisoprenoid-binding protein YceI
MKTHFTLIALGMLATLTACQSGSPSTASASISGNHGKAYKVDIAHSVLKWEAFKAVGKHQGSVPILEGTVFVDGTTITGGKVVLDMRNLQVTDLDGEDKQRLEAHLKGLRPGKEDDFFNTSLYPTATYTIEGSTPISGDADANLLVTGELTMKDITKPVNIRVKLDSGAAKAVKITAVPFVIDRTEWGIKFMSKKFFDDLKDNFVYDEIKIDLTVGAIR